VWKVAACVCFDVEFPETCRALAGRGAQLLLVPTALTNRFNAEVTVRSRAFESQLHICYANRVGPDPAIPAPFIGRSIIAAPDGRIMAQADDHSPGLIFASILRVDQDPLLAAATVANHYFSSLRSPLYHF
jgi:predicted amidohydrolase